MLRALVLAATAAAAIGFAAFATPANARIAAGATTPAVESNTVQARCHHHRWSSRWHCYRRHHFHHHHRWHRRHRHWH